jgi:hypothetical protein
MRMIPVATSLIAAALVVGTCVLSPHPGAAQSRPAPDTPGDVEVLEDNPPQPGLQLVDALRVLAVTSGIIGGFVAADIISGGVLTAPLLSGINAAAGSVRAVPQALGLRPVIATTVERPAVTELPEFRRTLGRALVPAPGTIR